MKTIAYEVVPTKETRSLLAFYVDRVVNCVAAPVCRTRNRIRYHGTRREADQAIDGYLRADLAACTRLGLSYIQSGAALVLTEVSK